MSTIFLLNKIKWLGLECEGYTAHEFPCIFSILDFLDAQPKGCVVLLRAIDWQDSSPRYSKQRAPVVAWRIVTRYTGDYSWHSLLSE